MSSVQFSTSNLWFLRMLHACENQTRKCDLPRGKVVMANRDQYFYDVCWEAGFDPSDPHDWVNIGILFLDPDVSILIEES